MNYKIEIADLRDKATVSELQHLIQEAFQSTALLPENRLLSNINSNATEPSFFLVAKENEKIIGCNGFIANDFMFNERHYVGYQSCWSATHPQHRGKAVFTGIINEAKEILKNKGAGFLYGIPNENSRPVFINKLEFTEILSMTVRIFNIPFYKRIYLKKTNADINDVCSINEEQVATHKMTQHPADIKTIFYNGSMIWGKLVKKRKFGIKVSAFYVGGIELKKETDLEVLFDLVFKIHKVLFVQLLSCETHSLNVLVRGWRRSKHMNGFIYYNLNMPEPWTRHFNVMIGAIDVF